MSAAPSLAVEDYAGTLDDVVFRHPWGEPPTAQGLDRLLVAQFLFGGRSIVNDGYLLAHPILFAGLGRPESVIRRLIDLGAVRIASIRQPISQSIAARAQSGVATHARLISSPDWPAIAQQLDSAGEGQARSGRDVRWPGRDLTAGYASLARRWRDSLATSALAADAVRTAAHFVDRFLGEIDRDPTAPRTKWEALAERDLAAGLPGPMHDRLMRAANQIYHINFAAAHVLTTGKPASVSTWADPQLPALLGVEVGRTGIRRHRSPVVPVKYASSTLVDQVAADDALLALRRRFLERWDDPAHSDAYSHALATLAHPGAPGLAPLPFLRMSGGAARLDLWEEGLADAADPASHDGFGWSGVARIYLTPEIARSALGEGPDFDRSEPPPE